MSSDPPNDDSSGRQLLILWLGRALPPISGLLLLLATWLPWVTLRISNPQFDISMGAEGLFSLLSLNQLSTPLMRRAVDLLLWTWEFASLSSVLFGLFLLRQRFPAKTTTILYGAWLVLVTAPSLWVIFGLLTTITPMSCWQFCVPMPVSSRQPMLGLWLEIAGLALGWIALGMHVRARVSGSAGAMASGVGSARYSSLHKVAATITLLGGALWAFGLYAVPWATSDCTGLHLSFNHFVRGTCSGADGYDMLGAVLWGDGRLTWLLLKLVSAVGLFVLISAWLPRLARTTWGIAIVWGLMTMLLFAIGVYGVQTTLEHPPQYMYGAATLWVPSYGVTICALGIVLGWVGVVLLRRTEIAQVRATCG
jgi:hypothetical protein